MTYIHIQAIVFHVEKYYCTYNKPVLWMSADFGMENYKGVWFACQIKINK